MYIFKIFYLLSVRFYMLIPRVLFFTTVNEICAKTQQLVPKYKFEVLPKISLCLHSFRNFKDVKI